LFAIPAMADDLAYADRRGWHEGLTETFDQGGRKLLLAAVTLGSASDTEFGDEVHAGQFFLPGSSAAIVQVTDRKGLRYLADKFLNPWTAGGWNQLTWSSKVLKLVNAAHPSDGIAGVQSLNPLVRLGDAQGIVHQVAPLNMVDSAHFDTASYVIVVCALRKIRLSHQVEDESGNQLLPVTKDGIVRPNRCSDVEVPTAALSTVIDAEVVVKFSAVDATSNQAVDGLIVRFLNKRVP
jgi:hypothetical protein